MKVLRPNFEKRGGLVDVIVKCGITQDVLMKASTDESGWRKTLETGVATYYSTSRNKPWVKGEESGNVQLVIDIHVDCDGDALIYIVVQKGQGVACHTEARTCFYRSVLGRGLAVPAPKAGEKERLEEVEVDVHESFFRLAKVDADRDIQPLLWNLGVLEHRLKQRAKASATESYTRQLLDKGTAKCAKKFGEEAVETVMAAVAESGERLVAESADVVYHLLVLLISRGLTFEMVEKELRRREGQSGLAEKSTRKPT